MREKNYGRLAVMSILFFAGLLLLPGFGLAEPGLNLCSCSIAQNPIEVVNEGASQARFFVLQTGDVSSWSTLTENNFVLEPGERKRVDSFVKPPCGQYGSFELKTEISSQGRKRIITQAVSITNCNSTPEINSGDNKNILERTGLNKSDILILLLLISGLLLFVLLCLVFLYLTLSVGDLYYTRVKIKEPNIIGQPLSKRVGQHKGIIIALLVILAIMIMASSLLLFLKYALPITLPPVNTSKSIINNLWPGNNSVNAPERELREQNLVNQTNSLKRDEPKNSSQNITDIVKNTSKEGDGVNSNFFETVGEFIVAYLGYAIIGILILVVLILFLNRQTK
jgi:hypothetical protein